MNRITIQHDTQRAMDALTRYAKCCAGPSAMTAAPQLSADIAGIYRIERERILAVMNAAATNTIDAALKRTVILQETVRDFARVVLPLKAFATVFENTPLEGTDTIDVPYYPLQTAASTDYDAAAGYTFGQATKTDTRTITVNKRKYQPLDYSSAEFRRQPWLDAAQLSSINAEKLGVDVLFDILSAITAANYGPAIKTLVPAAAMADDISDLRIACDQAYWPRGGRSLIVDSTIDAQFAKDPDLKSALAYGGPEVIREGKIPVVHGFNYIATPNLPDNGEGLVGMAVFRSALAAAFCPVTPAPGVRNRLLTYEIATDEASGVSINYRHWGDPQADRDYEVIESAYGYAPLVQAALKRICKPV